MTTKAHAETHFKHALVLRTVKLIDPFLLSIPFAFCFIGFYSKQAVTPYYWRGNVVIILLFLFLFIILGRMYDGFQISLKRISEMIYSQEIALLITEVIFYLIFILLIHRFPNPLPLIGCFIVQSILIVFWCYAAHHWYFKVFPPKQTVVIYDNRKGVDELINEYGLDIKFEVQAVIDVKECLNDDCAAIKDTDCVFLCGIHSHERNIILKKCIAQDIRVYVIPRIGDTIMSGAHPVYLFHLPILRVERSNPHPEYLIIKYSFDVLFSLIGLVVLSPLFLITSIAIKLEDHGPVFYKQTRLTKDAKEFEIIKFRSMRIDAEGDGKARLSTGTQDDRITKVGRVIRKIRVDELPQLINVLKGDMSFVGPRPERPEIAEQYEQILPEFSLRLQVKAGLTGLAQVYGQYNTTPYDKLNMDLMYIAHPGLAQDLRIIFATFKILFMPESTEGVAEGQVTALDHEDSRSKN